MHPVWHHGAFVITTDPSRLPLEVVRQQLDATYWAAGVSIDAVQRSFTNSLVFGAYLGDAVAGFGRVVTDYAAVAYIADVLVLAEYRGQGLGTALVSAILGHPDLQSVRSWCLRTRDAHELYERCGFTRDATTFMYRRAAPAGPGDGEKR